VVGRRCCSAPVREGIFLEADDNTRPVRTSLLHGERDGEAVRIVMPGRRRAKWAVTTVEQVRETSGQPDKSTVKRVDHCPERRFTCVAKMGVATSAVARSARCSAIDRAFRVIRRQFEHG
jgi:hypothetical protein